MGRNSPYRDMVERLLANSVLDPISGCWIWIGPRDKRPSTPYGKINIYVPCRGTVTRQAHIVSFETFIGPVPPGQELDHVCDYGFCICPNHLEPVDRLENEARKTYSRPRGGELTCYGP